MPAPPPPASPPAPVALDSIRWDELLRALEGKRKLLSSYYEHGRLLSVTGDTLEVGFADEFHTLGEIAREPEQLAVMKQFLRDHFGRPINVVIKLLSAAESAQAPARSVVEASRERAAEERKKRESEAREHPVTKLVLETFGAQIKEIKTDV